MSIRSALAPVTPTRQLISKGIETNPDSKDPDSHRNVMPANKTTGSVIIAINVVARITMHAVVESDGETEGDYPAGGGGSPIRIDAPSIKEIRSGW